VVFAKAGKGNKMGVERSGLFLWLCFYHKGEFRYLQSVLDFLTVLDFLGVLYKERLRSEASDRCFGH